MAKKKKRYKLKKQIWTILIVAIFLTIGITSFTKIRAKYLYEQTYEYKFLQIGYTKKEIKLLESNFDNKKLDELLKEEKDENLLELIQEKYYIKDNLNRYLAYQQENRTPIATTVQMVNINRDYEFYEITYDVDTNENYQMLVNKYHLLNSEYVPDDLVNISTKYSWGNDNYIRSEVYNAFLDMWNEAQKEDIYLMVNSAYRNYTLQEKVYNDYKENRGERYANSIAAKPGASEHQTGLALDIFELKNSSTATFKNSQAYTWLKENCYKFGFILRYPEGSEDITGYQPEAWHYRYLGKDLAEKVYNSNLTYDEYYAFYLAN